MKNLTFLLLFIGFIYSNFLFSQPKKEQCLTLHQGNFFIKNPDQGNLVIQRGKKWQKEIAENGAVVLKTKIVWTDECHYQLQDMKLLKGPNKKEWKELMQETIFVEIIEVTPQYHKIKCLTKSNNNVTYFTLWHEKKN